MSETLEEIAERIMQGYSIALSVTGKRGLKDAILSALRNERERCAKVAENKAETYRVKMQTQRRRGDHSLSEHFHSEQNAALEIATAIRKGQ